MNDQNDLDTFEEFDDFGEEEFDTYEQAKPQGFSDKLKDLWRNNPAFKFGVIVGSVIIVGGGAYAFMGGNKPAPVAPGTEQSRVGQGENVAGTVGGNVTPEYRDLLDQENQNRAKTALQSGQSALPTPIGEIADVAPVKEQPIDPLALWRQEEQKQTEAPAQILQQQAPQAQQAPPQDDIGPLTQAMQAQIASLMEAWQPGQATVVSFATANQQAPQTTTTTTGGAGASITPVAQKRAKVVVPAGDILYGAMITEANSDVPGPILAQVLSGPLKGGRVIGQFRVADDYLVLEFRTLSINGRSYSINAIALDPNTTLGGMATEVDQRYFSRLVLPAAASFISRFGDVISQPKQTTTVVGETVVISQEEQSTEDALYAGAGDAAKQVSSFVNNEANRIRPLVRVASNTPIGIFFVSPVTDQTQE